MPPEARDVSPRAIPGYDPEPGGLALKIDCMVHLLARPNQIPTVVRLGVAPAAGSLPAAYTR